ncbi:DUF1428 family protein [bacterium]|nr:DUF1428 family protein [bacterium]
MSNYIDAFVFPIAEKYLNEYKEIVEQVAEIWKEYGALSYNEFVGDDLHLEGTRSFIDAIEVKADDEVIFGWVVFPSKVVRDEANRKVPVDPRMEKLVAPLVDPKRMIFNADRMVYGGFKALVQK